MLNASKRLWLLPIAVATAFTFSLPFPRTSDWSDNALVLLEIPIAIFVATLVFTAILLPGAAAHVWFVHVLEKRGVRTQIRVSLALISSPLIGIWLLLSDRSTEWSGWLFYFGSMIIFAAASVWYGSKRSRRSQRR